MTAPALEEHDSIVLTRILRLEVANGVPVREYPAGTHGVIVAVYDCPSGYCVELFDGEKTIGVETAYADDIALRPSEVAPSSAPAL